MHSKHFMNKYLMDLLPYKTVSQEIWSINPHCWSEVLKLDWNEATIEPAPEVKKAVSDFASSMDFFHLYPSTHNKYLIKLLSQYTGVPEMNVQYFASSDSLHEYISKLYIGPRDKVLILWPSYDNFRSTAEANGANIVFSDMGKNFEFDFEKLKKDIKRENPKLAYICNPNNPTGHLITSNKIKELLESYPNTMFLIDEAYSEFAHQSVNGLALSYNNLLVTHTMSKAFALANMRFGYLVSAVDNIDAVNIIRNPKNITTLTQIAVTAALSNTEYMWKYVKEVILARERFIKLLQNDDLSEWIQVYPSESNFVLVKCKNIDVKSKLYYSLLEKKIYVRQLRQNSTLLNCIRITIGTREQMNRVYSAICEAFLTDS